MGVLRALSHADERSCSPACIGGASPLQGGALHGSRRVPLAHAAQRPASVVHGASADPALDQGGLLCSDGSRSAQVAAVAGRPAGAAFGGDSGRAHPALHARKRKPRRRRWRQAHKGFQGACGGRYSGPSVRFASDRRQRARARAGRRFGQRRPGGDGRERSRGLCRFPATPGKTPQTKRPGEEFAWSQSNAKKPRRALSFGQGAGWSSAPLPGAPVSAAWPETMNDCLPPSQDFIGWLSLLSCSIPSPIKVHDTL